MKERSILFSAPMIRALLSGSKTQTRRIVKPQPESVGFFEGVALPYWHVGGFRTHKSASNPLVCPHGAPGDRLWVRESLLVTDGDKGGDPEYLGQFIQYAADNACRGWTHDEDALDTLYPFNRATVPPIYMPRWASRLTLELTSVRVELLNDISEADAKAEGCDLYVPGHGTVSPFEIGCDPGYLMYGNYKQGYELLWESINGPGSWVKNPWVWVETFKVLEPNS